MKLMSYWLDTASPSGDYRHRPLPDSVDVAVIGAGLTGLSTALHLSREGASVALLETRTVGWGASGRNGGMATTGLAISYAKAVGRYGRERAAEMFEEYNHAIDTVESLVVDEDIDCDFTRAGKMSLACRPEHFAGFEKSAAMLSEHLGHKMELVPREEQHREIGSTRYHGAMVDPLGAGAHVGKLCHGLARAADNRGVSIHEGCEVSALRRRGRYAHDVQTRRGVVRAQQVVVATSGYTSSLTPWLQRRVVPIGSFIIVTEPLGEALAQELLPNGRMASDSNNLLHYFRITPDRRLLFGGRARFALSNPESDVESGSILQRSMVDVFPQLRGVGIDYCWGGLVDMTLDRMVHAGERDGVFYSVGYSGHGVQMATHMGKVMSQMLAGNKDANTWHGMRFPPVPGHFGRPWFLPAVGAFYKLVDRVK